MATNYIDKIKGTDNVTYDIRDSGALQLTGGQVTGPVTFGDTVQIDDLTASSAVVTGSASVANNLQVNTINGVAVGSSPNFNNTTYSAGTGLRLSGTQFINTKIPFVVGTQTAATGSWTGVCNDITALYDGLTIAYWLPYAGSGNATLNLTINGIATGAKNCYWSGANRLTTHYPAGSIIYFTYRSAGNIAGTNYEGWWAQAQYDSNTVSQLRWDYSTVYAGTAGIFPYTLVMMNSSGNYESIVTTSSTGTSKARNTTGFLIDSLAYAHVGSTTTNGNKVSASNYFMFLAYSALDFRYSANISTTSLTVGKPVYLVGRIDDTTGLFYLASNWWTQTLPSSESEEDLCYVYIGQTYNIASVTSEYRVNLSPTHPIYRYKNGALRRYGTDASTIDGKKHGLATIYSMTSAGSVTAGTKNVPTKIDTSKFNGGSYSHTGFSGGSFTRGAFSGGSLTMAINGSDSGQLDITFTAATHAADSFTAAVYGTDSFTAASLSSGFYTAGTANTPTAVTLPGRSSAIEVWSEI